VDCCGAARALDRGWEVAEAAVNGEPRQRQGSDEAWSSGIKKAVQMWVREGESEYTGSSGTCFKSRRRHGEREQVLAADGVRGGHGRSSGRGGAAWRA
jgi:hypothetical protein